MFVHLCLRFFYCSTGLFPDSRGKYAYLKEGLRGFLWLFYCGLFAVWIMGVIHTRHKKRGFYGWEIPAVLAPQAPPSGREGAATARGNIRRRDRRETVDARRAYFILLIPSMINIRINT